MAREPHLRGSAPTGMDRDLHSGWVIGFAGGITTLILVGGLACALLLTGFRDRLARGYPPASPIPEARSPVVFPEPRLQVAPSADMQAYREREERLLRSFGWVDRGAGIGRIPVQRAIELYADGWAAPAMTEPPDAGAASDGGGVDGDGGAP